MKSPNGHPISRVNACTPASGASSLPEKRPERYIHPQSANDVDKKCIKQKRDSGRSKIQGRGNDGLISPGRGAGAFSAPGTFFILK
jgi:hypothetical protein